MNDIMTRNHTAGKPATEQTESMPAAGKPARSRRNGENREAAAARLPTGARTYPVDDEPDLWMPMPGAFDRRYALGHIGACNRDHPPLTIIGMNPSYASEHWSDRTVNRLIELSHILRSQDGERYRGWLMLNIYPQRTSKPNLLDDYNNHLSNLNCDAIRYLLPELGVDSVLGAWGDLGGHQGRPNPTLK